LLKVQKAKEINEKLALEIAQKKVEKERREAFIEKTEDALERGLIASDTCGQGTANISKTVLKKVFAERIDAFARYYFAPREAERYDGIVKSPNSKMHWWLYDRLHKIIKEVRGTKTAIAAPRGNAKSMLTSVIFLIWCVVFEYKKHIILVSDTSDQAQKFLTTIKNELETNEKLIKDFPEACGKTKEWRISDIVTKNGCKIDTVGMLGAIRGTTHKGRRPDLVVMDDIENDENVATQEQRKKSNDFLNKKILKLGNSETDYFFIGTILHYDSLLAKTLNNPSWFSRKFKSVMRWSESTLWAKWEEIYTNINDDHRLIKSRKFFEANKEEMLKGVEILWPEHEPYLDLMEMKVGEGQASFNSEKQNEPIDPEDAFFREEDIVYFDERELRGKRLTIVGAVDPSLGRGNKSNPSAIITLAKDNEGFMYVLDADVRRRPPDQIILDVFGLHGIRDYDRFGVEEVLFQEFFKDEMIKRSRKLGVQLPVKGIKSRKDKKLRIESLQPMVKAGTIKFKRNQHALVSEMLQFPLGAQDDSLDALHMATLMFKKQFKIVTW
jgi:predicted phage terminase large subunit-like protein